MKPLKKATYNQRVLSPPVVLNQKVGVNRALPISFDNPPYGMSEDRGSVLSSNLGTVRPPIRGGYFKGNATNYVQTVLKSASYTWFKVSGWIYVSKYPNSMDTNEALAANTSVNDANGNGFHAVVSNKGSISLRINTDSGIKAIAASVTLSRWVKFEFGYGENGYLFAECDGKRNETYYGENLKNSSSKILYWMRTENITLDGRKCNFSVFGLKFESDTSSLFHKMQEKSGNIAFDSTGNGLHGSIIDAITVKAEDDGDSIHQHQDVKSYADDEGLNEYEFDLSKVKVNDKNSTIGSVLGTTLQLEVGIEKLSPSGTTTGYVFGWFTDTYNNAINWETGTLYTITISVSNLTTGYFYIKTGRSGGISSNIVSDGKYVITLIGGNAWGAYIFVGSSYCDAKVTLVRIQRTDLIGLYFPASSLTKDCRNKELTFKGVVPSLAKFTNSPCLVGNAIAYATGDVLTTDTITAFGNSAIPACTVDGRLDFAYGQKYYGATIKRDGIVIAQLPFCEVIDYSSGNHFINNMTSSDNFFLLIDGDEESNSGLQDEFHYNQMRSVNGAGYWTDPFIGTNIIYPVSKCRRDVYGPKTGETTEFDLFIKSGGTQKMALWSVDKANSNIAWYILPDGTFRFHNGSAFDFQTQLPLDRRFNLKIKRTATLIHELYVDDVYCETMGNSYFDSRDMRLIGAVQPSSSSNTYPFRGIIYSFKTFNHNTGLMQVNIPNMLTGIDISGNNRHFIPNNISIVEDISGGFNNSGCNLQLEKFARAIQADTENIFFDTDGNPIPKPYTSLKFGNYKDKYFSQFTPDTINQIVVHDRQLKEIQLQRELVARNIVTGSGIGSMIIGLNFKVK